MAHVLSNISNNLQTTLNVDINLPKKGEGNGGGGGGQPKAKLNSLQCFRYLSPSHLFGTCRFGKSWVLFVGFKL